MPRRVLIADDNDTIRRTLCSEVAQVAGIEVCATVSNGIEAVESAISLRPDVLILDLLMPGLTGVQVAGILKRNLPAAKIILFTLYSDVITPQMVTALGATLVSKSEGLRALARALRETLESRTREVNEGLARAVHERATDPEDLDLLTDQVSAPLTRCSRDLKYVWVNERYANFLKRPLEKIVGHSILDVLGKSAFDAVQRYFDQVLRGEDVSYEIEVEYKSAGHRKIAAFYKPTLNASGSPDGWLAYVEDLTLQADVSMTG
ncbi:MAG TPA: response regulator [Candidatus Sulfotelmatobacter sp.]|nr:response regulator [Candidatus Sulfotelmatobacter sp.]